ncbi:MAG: hypothetical protein HZB38_10055 [Planctomycetes bacterium]|nr:hypothetical protein [Planctomycetota bacterium]
MVAVTALCPAQTYSIVDLGTLGGPISGAYAINDFGRVAGVSTRADASTYAFIWNDGLTKLDPLAGDHQSHGFAITNNDRVLAASYDLGEVVVHGFAWENDVVTPLGDFLPRRGNAAGTIVGYVTVFDPSFGWVDRAARWTGGSLIEMGTLGGHFSYAYGMTEDGRVVGSSRLTNDATQHAFLWQAGAFHDLGTLGGSSSQAYAINAAGDVVGWSDTIAGAPHGFLFSTDAGGNVTSRTDLGDLSGGHSYAYAVNNHGQVVGASGSRAFVWQSGVMTDLNTMIPAGAGWRLESAWDINDSGQIVGIGTHMGFPHAFLMTPNNCPDFDGNGVVELADLAVLLSHFGTAGGATFGDGDIDGDGDVDLSDLAALLSLFGASCP